MICVEGPGAIPAALANEPTERGPKSSVRAVAEPGQDPESDEQIVVVVMRVVNSEPRRIPDPPFVHQPVTQKELRPSLDRPTHRFVAKILRDFGKGGESLPAVERARLPPGETVPTPVRLLSSNDPLEASSDDRMIEVAVADERPRRITCAADFTVRPSQEVRTFFGPATHDELRSATNPGIVTRHAKIGQEEEAPVRGDVLGPVDLLVRRAGSDPTPVRKLMGENPPGPPCTANLVVRGADLRVVWRPALYLTQKPPVDTGVGRRSYEPTPDPRSHPHSPPKSLRRYSLNWCRGDLAKTKVARLSRLNRRAPILAVVSAKVAFRRRASSHRARTR
jgi:hypothetical protein